MTNRSVIASSLFRRSQNCTRTMNRAKLLRHRDCRGLRPRSDSCVAILDCFAFSSQRRPKEVPVGRRDGFMESAAKQSAQTAAAFGLAVTKRFVIASAAKQSSSHGEAA